MPKTVLLQAAMRSWRSLMPGSERPGRGTLPLAADALCAPSATLREVATCLLRNCPTHSLRRTANDLESRLRADRAAPPLLVAVTLAPCIMRATGIGRMHPAIMLATADTEQCGALCRRVSTTATARAGSVVARMSSDGAQVKNRKPQACMTERRVDGDRKPAIIADFRIRAT